MQRVYSIMITLFCATEGRFTNHNTNNKSLFYISFQLSSDSVPEDWYFHHRDPRFYGGAHQCLYLDAAIKRNKCKEGSKAKNKNTENPKSMSQRFPK